LHQQESVPYLLGSGGTLIFDVTIVIQSLVYAPKKTISRRGEFFRDCMRMSSRLRCAMVASVSILSACISVSML